jgi:predicted transcriptional regulator YheO
MKKTKLFTNASMVIQAMEVAKRKFPDRPAAQVVAEALGVSSTVIYSAVKQNKVTQVTSVACEGIVRRFGAKVNGPTTGRQLVVARMSPIQYPMVKNMVMSLNGTVVEEVETLLSNLDNINVAVFHVDNEHASTIRKVIEGTGGKVTAVE